MWREKVPGILLGMQIGYSHYENQYGDLKKLRIKLPYDQAIPLLDVYQNELESESERKISAFPYSLKLYKYILIFLSFLHTILLLQKTYVSTYFHS